MLAPAQRRDSVLLMEAGGEWPSTETEWPMEQLSGQKPTEAFTGLAWVLALCALAAGIVIGTSL